MTKKKNQATDETKAPTNGGKPAKKTPSKAPKPRPKKLEEMTLEEVGMLAWELAYKNRHKRLD